MSRETRHSNGSNGNGSGGSGGFDDFGEFIRDRETEFAGERDEPFGGEDPFADFGQRHRSNSGGGFDRGVVDAIVGLVDGLSSIAGDALSPELRDKVERALRELLVVLRDLITALIDRLDGKQDAEPRIEEIPID